MSDTPEQIIEDAIWSALETQEEPMGGPWVDRDMRMIDSSGSEVDMTAAVTAALAALKDARYHVVKLPEPDRVTTYGQAWAPKYFTVWNLTGDGDCGVLVGGIGPRSAEDARALAAALLAAADSAEDTK